MDPAEFRTPNPKRSHKFFLTKSFGRERSKGGSFEESNSSNSCEPTGKNKRVRKEATKLAKPSCMFNLFDTCERNFKRHKVAEDDEDELDFSYINEYLKSCGKHKLNFSKRPLGFVKAFGIS